MPTFTKTVRFYDIQGERSATVEATMDPGATFCQVPEEVADQLGLRPVGLRRLRVADGRALQRGVANALVELPEQGEAVATLIVIGEAGAPVLLGALALDALGLGIDTQGKRLIPKVSDLLSETAWPTL